MSSSSSAKHKTPRKGFDRQMSFLEHLEELRWHLARSAIAILVGMVLSLSFIQDIVSWVILAPMRPSFPINGWLCEWDPGMCVNNLKVSLQSISPTEDFTRAIFLGIMVGLVAAFPYVVWEVWRFVRPGLKINERRRTRGVVFWVSLLFFTGVGFSYFILTPFALSFFANFQLVEGAEKNWRIGEVVSLVIQMCVAGGILFQMPMVANILSRLEIITPTLMRKKRKYAVVVIMILAGILTPSPDIMSQLIMAGPMYLLYEISIFISAGIERRRLKAEAAEVAERQARRKPNPEIAEAVVVDIADAEQPSHNPPHQPAPHADAPR